jgi:hypothetical protein
MGDAVVTLQLLGLFVIFMWFTYFYDRLNMSTKFPICNYVMFVDNVP